MKLRFRYSISGESYVFDIEPRETAVSVTLDSLRNVGGTGYGYAKRTYGTKEYIAKNPNFDGYELLLYWPASMTAAIDFTDTAHCYELHVNNMLYDHSKNIDSLTRYDGQEMTFDDAAGKIDVTFFVRTEIIGGEPVSRWHGGGIFNVRPSGSNNPVFGAPSNIQGTYTTDADKIPRMYFCTVTVTDGDDSYKCLYVAIRGSDPGYNTVAYLFDVRMFDGSGAKPAPPDQKKNVTPWGYTGTWNYSSTSDTVEAPTGYSFVNRWAHGIRLYWVNDNNVEGLMQDLYGATLIDMLNSAKYKLITGIICLHKIPLTPDHGTTESPTIFGKRLGSNLLNTCSKITKQVYTIPGSPVTLEGISQSAFDYSRYSSLHVRLPFIGTVPIDIDAVMDGTIRTVYHIDILTGNCMAQVFCRNSSNGAEILLFQGGGNCAIPIPYSGNDQGGFKQLGAFAGVAAGVVASVASGGAALPLIGTVGSAAGAIGTPAATTAHYTPTEISTLGSKKVCYILETHKPLLTDTYSSVNGFPASSGAAGDTVSTYSGSGLLTGLLHADISGATDSEKAAIEAAFKEGVIV